MLTCLTIALLHASACSSDDVIAPTPTESLHNDPIGGQPAAVHADAVDDLHVTSSTLSSVTLTWTQVDDGTGRPAFYRVKYAVPPIDWRSAAIGCEQTIRGTAVGAEASCTVEGLASETAYEFQLMSYRLSSSGTWQGAVYSNVATGSTGAASAAAVSDLAVVSATESTLTLSWTEVD
ncbi:MAG TPA: fibronectin type III domain-containing protein, partial [Longimicrobiales bacterium]|nr:fibronectin type III domain-containing protein [Longimicrobiales bacterium]